MTDFPKSNAVLDSPMVCPALVARENLQVENQSNVDAVIAVAVPTGRHHLRNTRRTWKIIDFT
jgi:hypothetical protein